MERTVRTRSGRIYFIVERGGWFYVSKPGWMGRKGLGSARTYREALDLVERDAGEALR